MTRTSPPAPAEEPTPMGVATPSPDAPPRTTPAAPTADGQLLQLLLLFAEHERGGQPPPRCREARAVIPMKASDFVQARRALLDDGRLCETRKAGQRPVVTLTDAGWLAVNRKPPSPHGTGPAIRTCLHCRQVFNSAGAGNRICPRCSALDIFQAGNLG
ncbi:hypothetical protein M2352_004329 [Azospirillum fermentarium]|uniref:hypothetical protein n=1 Tax=Azospirillum fermentarium TaxID=1233114 RepID=UPI0022267A88|nr:hypothetical protein [Azospirillum fermentarium]MCW2248669.1 hypothetical protein [Azospirillum fermentarium]